MLKVGIVRLNLVKDDSSRALTADVNELFQVLSPKIVKLAGCTRKRSRTH
jgi:hypothetical protein